MKIPEPPPRLSFPMAPLVDIGILLLIFFLLDPNFGGLERKLAARLPADRHM